MTSAGWCRPGKKVVTRTGHAARYWHLLQIKRRNQPGHRRCADQCCMGDCWRTGAG